VTGEATEPLTGTWIRWHLKAAAGRVAEARYEVRGCPHTVAATALAATGLPGSPVDGAGPDLHDLLRQLEAPPAKLGRFFVIQDALHKALLQLRARTA
jgi:NifU-like protein involved in Fe-S cluster formation